MKGDFCDRIPDITEEQQEQIKELRTGHMKEMLPLRNQVQEKRAHLQTVSSGENVDMDEVNNAIEDISKLKMEMAKKRAAHRQQIRNVLTEDQRVFFDSKPMKKRKHRNFEGRNERCGNRPGKRF
jgi:Spy/CpxP family protein refolding chaperone